jgi:hypothetical protein
MSDSSKMKNKPGFNSTTVIRMKDMAKLSVLVFSLIYLQLISEHMTGIYDYGSTGNPSDSFWYPDNVPLLLYQITATQRARYFSFTPCCYVMAILSHQSFHDRSPLNELLIHPCKNEKDRGFIKI